MGEGAPNTFITSLLPLTALANNNGVQSEVGGRTNHGLGKWEARVQPTKTCPRTSMSSSPLSRDHLRPLRDHLGPQQMGEDGSMRLVTEFTFEKSAPMEMIM